MTRQKNTTSKNENIDDMMDDKSPLTNAAFNNLMRMLLTENEQFHKDLITQMHHNNKELIDSLNNGFTQLTTAINFKSDEDKALNKQLLSKLDNLTNAIKDSSTSYVPNNKEIPVSTPTLPKPDEKQLKTRNDKFYQAFRSQEISNYYSSLISQEEPFIPPTFRPKLGKNTPEYEKDIKRNHAVDNVKREIDLLNARVTQFKQIIEEIDNKYLNQVETSNLDNENKVKITSEYKKRIENDEEQTRKEWLKNFHKLQDTYNKEQESATQCIFKIIDEADNDNPQQNFRQSNQYHRPYRHRAHQFATQQRRYRK